MLNRMGQIPKVLVIRMRFVPFLDATGVAALENLMRECHGKGIAVIFSAVQPQPMTMLSKAEFGPAGSAIRYAESYSAAIKMAEEDIRQESAG
jgi:SulP family sulfate permease